MSRHDWKIGAVLLGSVVNLGGSLVVGILFAGIAAVSLAAAGGPPGYVSDKMMMSVGGLAVLTGIGTACAVGGGYVAARIAKTKQIQHALVTAIPCALLGLTGTGSVPLWCSVLSYALLFPAAAVGGLWARSRKRSLPQTSQP